MEIARNSTSVWYPEAGLLKFLTLGHWDLDCDFQEQKF
jgi:hypothetical protein